MCFNGEKSSSCKAGMLCHFPLQRAQALSIFRAVFSCMVVRALKHHTDYLLLFFLITSLILRGALRGKLLGTEHWEEQGGAAPSHCSHSKGTLGSHCRTPEMQLLHVMAFHTFLVQTQTTAQNTSQRSWVSHCA